MNKFYTLRRAGRAQLTAKMSLDFRPSDTPAQNRTWQRKQTTEPYLQYQEADPIAAAEALFPNLYVNTHANARSGKEAKHLTDLLLPSPVGVLATGQA